MRASFALLATANIWLGLSTFARAALWDAAGPLATGLLTTIAHPNRVFDALLPVAWLPAFSLALIGFTGSKRDVRRASALAAASAAFLLEWRVCWDWIETRENQGVRRVARSIAAALRDGLTDETGCAASADLGAIVCTRLCVTGVEENRTKQVQVLCHQGYLRDAIVYPPLHAARAVNSDVVPGGVQFVPGS